MQVRAPRIGVTTYGRENGRFSLPVEYVDSVRRAGGVGEDLGLPLPHTAAPRTERLLQGPESSGGGERPPVPTAAGGRVGARHYSTQ